MLLDPNPQQQNQHGSGSTTLLKPVFKIVNLEPLLVCLGEGGIHHLDLVLLLVEPLHVVLLELELAPAPKSTCKPEGNRA